MIEREHACEPLRLAPALGAKLSGYDWARNTVGESGAAVYRLSGRAGRPELYLKHGVEFVAEEIAAETARLEWLSDYLPVPDVSHFGRDAAGAWLLTTAIDGKTAHQALQAGDHDRLALVDAITDFLRALHAIPASRCPFDSGHAGRRLEARARIDANLVNTDDFDDERSGWSAEQVWAAMQESLPFDADTVVTHGDYSLDNIILRDGVVVGCIDVGRTGIADRYQDLAILWNCLAEFGPDLQHRLFARYGIGQPDRRELRFHLLLDELF